MIIDVWTDGSVVRNPGPGGWAAILVMGNNYRVIGGNCVVDTTNNRMETFAVIIALEALKTTGITLRLHTDSQYVEKCIARTLRGKLPEKNTDIWRLFWHRKIEKKADFIVEWIPGHGTGFENNLADAVAGYCAFNRKSIDIRLAEEQFKALNAKRVRAEGII